MRSHVANGSDAKLSEDSEHLFAIGIIVTSISHISSLHQTFVLLIIASLCSITAHNLYHLGAILCWSKLGLSIIIRRRAAAASIINDHSNDHRSCRRDHYDSSEMPKRFGLALGCELRC